jgi:hypothetical protein
VLNRDATGGHSLLRGAGVTLTLEALRRAADIDRPGMLWQHYLALSAAANERSLRERGRRANYLEHVQFDRGLPRPLQVVVRFITFDGDLLNGGIRQVFFNHAPCDLVDTLRALREIGAAESAQALADAMQYY